MVAYARSRHPGIDFRVGDLRDLNLGRRFDLILCLGFGVNYLLANADLERGVAAFARHSRPGSLLIVETINSIGDPSGGNLPPSFVIETEGVVAHGVATYAVDRHRQLLERRRVWTSPGQEPDEDYVRFRMIFPMELESYLNRHGFDVVGVYDNTELRKSDLRVRGCSTRPFTPAGRPARRSDDCLPGRWSRSVTMCTRTTRARSSDDICRARRL